VLTDHNELDKQIEQVFLGIDEIPTPKKLQWILKRKSPEHINLSKRKSQKCSRNTSGRNLKLSVGLAKEHK